MQTEKKDGNSIHTLTQDVPSNYSQKTELHVQAPPRILYLSTSVITHLQDISHLDKRQTYVHTQAFTQPDNQHMGCRGAP